MKESNEILTMRAIAWERAKGELFSYLQTFWPSFSSNGSEIDNGYEISQELISEFIENFERNCR